MVTSGRILLLVWIIGSLLYAAEIWFSIRQINNEYDYSAATWQHIIDVNTDVGTDICKACTPCHSTDKDRRSGMRQREVDERLQELAFCTGGWLLFTLGIALARHYHIKGREERELKEKENAELLEIIKHIGE